MPLQVLGDVLVGLIVVVGGAVGVAFKEPLVSLSPVVFVLAVVVISSLRYADLKEIRIAEHGIRSSVASARVAVDPGTIKVDPGIALGELCHPRYLVGQGVVAHVAEVSVVEFLGAPGVSHTVNLNNDEAQLREGLRIAARSRKGPASDAALLRARIDVVDDGILLAGKIG